MAEDKKSFLLYADYIELFSELSDEDAGKLIKVVFSYVNDEDPVILDKLINISFIPIKLQLKRDLKKYEHKKELWSGAGKRSAEARALKKANEKNNTSTESTDVKSVPTESTVNVTVTDTVTDTVNVTVIDIKEELGKKKDAAIAATAQRKEIFFNSLIPFKAQYPKEMIRKFYDVWSELNSTGTKMKWELEKTWETSLRLSRWSKNEKPKNGFIYKDPEAQKTVTVNY